MVSFFKCRKKKTREKKNHAEAEKGARCRGDPSRGPPPTKTPLIDKSLDSIKFDSSGHARPPSVNRPERERERARKKMDVFECL